MDRASVNVTALLQRARELNREEWQALYGAVEGELRKIARAYLQRSPDHLLQPTVLINDALVRLALADGGAFKDRQQFYRIASGVMRRILVDHARRQRPGSIDGPQLADLGAAGGPAPDDRLRRAERLLALDRALDRLRDADPQAADLFETHYFGGLRLSLGASAEEWIIQLPQTKPSLQETATALGIPRATAYRIFHRAKEFLRNELEDEFA